MTTERTGLLKFAGQDVTIIGDDLAVGAQAPEFTVHANDWAVVRGLTSTAGKVRIIAAVPSLNTAVCDRETRRFNLEAAALGQDIAMLVVSMDLPWAQKTWCGAAGIDKVVTLSDHKDASFGLQYGVLIKEQRILRRAVFVVDRSDKLVYVAYMAALGEEPDYQAVLAAAKAAL
jgi:thiol peroxidase